MTQPTNLKTVLQSLSRGLYFQSLSEESRQRRRELILDKLTRVRVTKEKAIELICQELAPDYMAWTPRGDDETEVASQGETDWVSEVQSTTQKNVVTEDDLPDVRELFSPDVVLEFVAGCSSSLLCGKLFEQFE